MTTQRPQSTAAARVMKTPARVEVPALCPTTSATPTDEIAPPTTLCHRNFFNRNAASKKRAQIALVEIKMLDSPGVTSFAPSNQKNMYTPIVSDPRNSTGTAKRKGGYRKSTLATKHMGIKARYITTHRDRESAAGLMTA